MSSRSCATRVAGRWLLPLGLLVFGIRTDAAELDFGLHAALGHSDNITRVASEKIDESIAAAGGDLLFSHESRRLTALAAGSLAYLDYRDDTYDDEVIGNLFADAAFRIVPERFTWVVQDNFGQAPRNSLDPVTPANRENINYLTTGPDLIFPLGSRTSLRFEGRYSDIYYEESEFDSDELYGAVILSRFLTSASAVSLHGSVTSTTYDNHAFGIDTDEYEAFVRYEVEAARTTVGLDAGYTELRFGEPLDDTSDGYLFRLDLTRVLGPSSTLMFAGGREFSNAVNVLRRLQTNPASTPDLSTQPVQIVGSPFENTYARLDWVFARNRTELGAGAGHYQEDYEAETQFDRKRTSYYLYAGRQVNRSLSVRADAGYARERYESIDREFAETTANIGFDWLLGRKVYMSLMYRWIDRSNDELPANEFTENQAWLFVGYTYSGRGSRVGASRMPGLRGQSATRGGRM